MAKQEFSYRIEYEIDKKTKQVVATIPELNHISSFGDSFAEAEANVREAALGYLEVFEKKQKRIPIPIGTLYNIVVHQAKMSIEEFNNL